MLLGVVSPDVVSEVTAGPYEWMPSPVLIAKLPLCSRASERVGQRPLAPAWMCRKCGCPFRSPSVFSVTVAWSPARLTVAVPLPVTWLVGTGAVVEAYR